MAYKGYKLTSKIYLSSETDRFLTDVRCFSTREAAEAAKLEDKNMVNNQF